MYYVSQLFHYQNNITKFHYPHMTYSCLMVAWCRMHLQYMDFYKQYVFGIALNLRNILGTKQYYVHGFNEVLLCIFISKTPNESGFKSNFLINTFWNNYLCTDTFNQTRCEICWRAIYYFVCICIFFCFKCVLLFVL